MASTTKGRSPGKLATYRAKRDFARTPEPAGRVRRRPPAGAPVRRAAPPGPPAALRPPAGGRTASWSAGRCRRARRSTPKAPRLAVHVEDHPLDYFDFEGVIPAGEYGGGDVIVWDWGTWEPADDATIPARPIADGDLHFDLHGEKLQRPLRARPARRRRRRQGAVAAAPQARRRRRDRLGSRGPPPLGQERAHQRRGARPSPSALAQRPADGRGEGGGRSGRRRPTASWPRSTTLGKAGEWEFRAARARAHQPRQGAVPRPDGRAGRSPSATSSATTPASRPTMLPYLADRPLNLHRFPNGVDRPGLLAQGACPTTRRTG